MSLLRWLGLVLVMLVALPVHGEQTSSTSEVVFETPGVIMVREGRACAESRSKNASWLQIEGREALPSYTTQATVLLNGWRLVYIDAQETCHISDETCFVWQRQPPRIDHHIEEAQAFIDTIAQDGDTLTWRAVGFLIDDGRDDAFAFCYHYTTIAWNETFIDARVAHSDPFHKLGLFSHGPFHTPSSNTARTFSQSLFLHLIATTPSLPTLSTRPEEWSVVQFRRYPNVSGHGTRSPRCAFRLCHSDAHRMGALVSMWGSARQRNGCVVV